MTDLKIVTRRGGGSQSVIPNKQYNIGPIQYLLWLVVAMLASGISDIGPVGIVLNCFRLLRFDIGVLPDWLWYHMGNIAALNRTQIRP